MGPKMVRTKKVSESTTPAGAPVVLFLEEDLGEPQVGQPGVIFKAFSATKAKDRAVLGETVTEWLRSNGLVGVRCWVNQSSDREFHCLSLSVLAVPASEATP